MRTMNVGSRLRQLATKRIRALVGSISIYPGTLPVATDLNPYSQQLSAAGGVGPYTFAVVAGTLPSGLTLSAGGLLAGTPNDTLGVYGFTVEATDALSHTGRKPYSLILDDVITIAPTTLPDATNDTAYSRQLTATGGTGSGFNYSILSGALPADLSLSAAGLISGTPDDAQDTYGFTVRATDSIGGFGDQALTILLHAHVTLTPTVLPTATDGIAYSQQLTGHGGTAPYSFSVTAGTLPVGLTLSAGGLLDGNSADVSGPYPFTVTATDALGDTGNQSYTLEVDQMPLAISPTSPIYLPPATAGDAYSEQLTASGGSGTGYSFSVASGAMPDGLTLSSAGLIDGTPDDQPGGTFTFSIGVTDSLSQSDSQAYGMTLIEAPVTMTPTTLPDATNTVAYSQQLTGAGGSGTGYSFSLVTGVLPSGLTLSASGLLDGTPSDTVGNFALDIQATDSLGTTGSQGYALALAPAPLRIQLISDTDVFQNQNFTTPATGEGDPVKSWADQGTNDNGIAGSNGAVLHLNVFPSGAPSVQGDGVSSQLDSPHLGITQPYTMIVLFKCENGTGSRLVFSSDGNGISVNVAVSNHFSGAAQVADADLGPNDEEPHVLMVEWDGATTKFSLDGGAETTVAVNPGPAGFAALALFVGGSVPNIGQLEIYEGLLDSGAKAARIAAMMTYGGLPFVYMTPTTLPDAHLLIAYDQQLTGHGGSGTGYSFSVTSGALPSGITLSAGGHFTGTAVDTPGPFTFDVEATDSLGTTGTQSYTLTLQAV